MKTRRKSRGFGLLILLIAIFIIATLGITVLAEYSIKDAQRKADSSRLQRIYKAITGDPATDTFGYLGDVGSYPTTLSDLFQNPGATGWNGPYLSEDLFSGSTVNDSFGSPMEYYLNLAAGSNDELALISKGEDHTSTSTASNPNNYTQFAGALPTSGSYLSSSGNSDNRTFPDVSVNPSSSTDYVNTGSLEYNIVNKDTNQANAIVNACPNEYSLVITSSGRGAADAMMLPYNPGMMIGLLQGFWNVSVTSGQAESNYFSENLGIYPGHISSRRLRVEDIDSNNTAAFTLTYVNNTLTKIQVKRFGMNAGPPVKAGATSSIANVKACGTMTAITMPGNATVDTWVMPWGAASTHVTGTTQSSLTITNANASNLTSQWQLQVYGNDGLLLGTVYQRKAVVFSNIDSGTPIVVTSQSGAGLDSFSMPASATSKTY